MIRAHLVNVAFWAMVVVGCAYCHESSEKTERIRLSSEACK